MKAESTDETNIAPPNAYDGQVAKDEYIPQDSDAQMGGSTFNQGAGQGYNAGSAADDNYGPINVKEDG